MKSNSSLPAAVIFDMDGVLIDSNPFHVQKWAELLRAHGIRYRAEDLPRQILGYRNDTLFRLFFSPQLAHDEMEQLSEELEERFRSVFREHARLPPGLEALINECRTAGVPMAIASSAMSKNIDFVVEVLRLRPYFTAVVSGDGVSHPKPDPEIYVRAAEELQVARAHCVAFEDSFVGIESAKGAEMKCVGIASSFPAEELRRQTPADLVVNGFEELSLARLRSLFAR